MIANKGIKAATLSFFHEIKLLEGSFGEKGRSSLLY